MKHTLVLRIAIGVPESLISLSAIGGGIVMLAGTYQDGVLREAGGRGQFPLEWLRNTPFSDYTIPALILMIGVGGSSLIAAVLVFIGHEAGVLASLVAGLVMVGYIVVEVVMLKQGISWIESLYFGPGLLVSGLATFLRRSSSPFLPTSAASSEEAAPPSGSSACSFAQLALSAFQKALSLHW